MAECFSNNIVVAALFSCGEAVAFAGLTVLNVS